MLLFDFMICSFGISIDIIVTVASMVGGVLQPFLMWALVRCANDSELMAIRPQSVAGNVAIYLSVLCCIYLSVAGVVGVVVSIWSDDTISSNVVAGVVTLVAAIPMGRWIASNRVEAQETLLY